MGCGFTLLFPLSRPEWRTKRSFAMAAAIVGLASLFAAPMLVPAASLFSNITAGNRPLDVALTWSESTEESILSFVNGIPTSSGGTHENGFKSGVTKAVRNYLGVQNLVPKGLVVSAEDTREGRIPLDGRARLCPPGLSLHLSGCRCRLRRAAGFGR